MALVVFMLAGLGALFVVGLIALCFRRTRLVGGLLVAVPILGVGFLSLVAVRSFEGVAQVDYRGTHVTVQRGIPLDEPIMKDEPAAGDSVQKTVQKSGQKTVEKRADKTVDKKAASNKKTVDKKAAHPVASDSSSDKEKSKKSTGMIRSLRNAVGEMFTGSSTQVKSASKPVPAPVETPMPPQPPIKVDPAVEKEKPTVVTVVTPPAPKIDDSRMNALVKSLVGAVVEEMPEGADEYTALRMLGHYLGRAIAAEQARTDDPERALTPLASPAQTDRPAWVGAPDGRYGKGYQMVIKIGPYTSRSVCEQGMPRALEEAAREYAQRLLGRSTHGQDLLSYEYMRERIVKEEWEEQVEEVIPGEPMVSLHLLLRFDEDDNRRIKGGLHENQVKRRVAIVGSILGGFLLVLGLTFGALKFDQATEGRFRKLGAAVLVVGGVLAAGVVLLLMEEIRPIPERRPAVEVLQPITHHDEVPPPRLTQVLREASEARESASVSVSSRARAGGRSQGEFSWAAIGVLLVVPSGLVVFRRTRTAGTVLLGTGVAVVVILRFLVS
ncbi:MAG: hypothetical protein JW818_12655 [Pirellulales bacterium]|nr:hypothetical protein [Pirellulales bacterium]